MTGGDWAPTVEGLHPGDPPTVSPGAHSYHCSVDPSVGSIGCAVSTWPCQVLSEIVGPASARPSAGNDTKTLKVSARAADRATTTLDVVAPCPRPTGPPGGTRRRLRTRK